MQCNRLGLGIVLAVLAFVIGIPHLLYGDLIILKDGFVVEGNTKRESTTEVDAVTREPFIVPKGFFYVDDGPRRVYFSQSLVRVADKKEPVEGEKILHPRRHSILNARRMVPIEGIIDTTRWDTKWERTMTFLSEGRTLKVGQHISELTPYWARADGTTSYYWSCAYLTKELSLETIHSLIANHPGFQEPNGISDEEKAKRRIRFTQFFAQAGFYGEAERELFRMMRDLPDHKELAEANLKVIRNVQTREAFEAIKRRHVSGQYEKVRSLLEQFPEKHASEKTVAEFDEFKVEYDSAFSKLERAKAHLKTLAQTIKGDNSTDFFDAAALIYRQVHPGNLDRLDAFVGQARQADRQRRRGDKPTLDEAQLLSLAVSGWLLGSASAGSDPDQALQLWKARTMLIDYLKNKSLGGRKGILAEYLASEQSKKNKPLSTDIFVKMIADLSPPLTEEDTRPLAREIAAEADGVTYLVKLPPEYSHSRSYPVIVLLHNADEKPLTMIRRWSRKAAEHGYILMAPYWSQGLGGTYTYSPTEHATVTEGLRDLSRRFNVDSDRVFLFGLGQGADMAYDVGLSHPHLFAGVIPMGGHPNYFGARYWRNGQYLPFLVINGDRSGESNKATRKLFDIWILRSFPTIWIQYKGRGIEWFGGELDNMFDWMRIKRRHYPLYQLGVDGSSGLGKEFNTMRTTDNRFYWISVDGIHPRRINDASRWSNLVDPATVTGNINPVTNVINVRSTGVRQLTIWLGRNSKGESMINFAKPVTVQYRFTVKVANRKIDQDLGILLEDLYQRADRRQLFLAKIEIN